MCALLYSVSLWQSEKWRKGQVCLLDHVSQFWLKIWAFAVPLLLNICTDLLKQTELTERECCEINYYEWWDEGLWVWCWIKSASFTGEIKSSIKEIYVCVDEICSLCSLFSSSVEIFVHYTFLPGGQTVNFEFCLTILKYMWEAAQKKQMELWWEHTCYSPGLFPAEFLLFPKLKVNFTGRQFESVGEIQEKKWYSTYLRFLQIIVEC
jgi:hypothetical protein